MSCTHPAFKILVALQAKISKKNKKTPQFYTFIKHEGVVQRFPIMLCFKNKKVMEAKVLF